MLAFAAAACSSGDFAVANANGSDSGVGGGDAVVDTSSSGDTSSPLDAPADVPAGEAGLSLADACAIYATAVCKRLEACIPFFLTFGYGDRVACIARVTKNCVVPGDAPGTHVTHDRIVECAAAYDAEACSGILAEITPDVCIPPPGDLPLGASCATGQQCQTGSCDAPLDQLCGKCTAGDEGADCVTTCKVGLVCARDGKCHTPVMHGTESCDPISQPCDSVFACVAGKCVPRGTSVGTPCDPSAATLPDCSFVSGLWCPTSSTGTGSTCASIGIASGTDPCADTATKLIVCKGPAYCSTTTCVSLVADGAKCDGTTLRCMAGAKCIGGTCVIPDGASCK